MNSVQNRRIVLKAAAGLAVAAAAGRGSDQQETPTKIAAMNTPALDEIPLPTPTGRARQALQKLIAGNARFTKGKAIHPNQSLRRVEAVAGQQTPYAVVLTCADSRVSPELLFDAGIGDLFVLRVAGNIVDETLLGSVEYAVEHLGTPLVVVLGHENCGAVKAAIESSETGTLPTNNVKSIIELLLPVVEAVEAEGPIDAAQLVDAVVTANARHTASQILQRTELQKEYKGLGMVAARYDLDTATVTLLN